MIMTIIFIPLLLLLIIITIPNVTFLRLLSCS